MRTIILNIAEPLLVLGIVVWLFYAVQIGTCNFDLETELAALPESCAAEISHWKVERASSKMMSEAHADSEEDSIYASANFIGITFVPEEVIWLSTIDYEAKKALIHEIGHACDYNNGFPSKTEEFMEIFDSEAKGYGATNEQEFFAETYKCLAKGHPNWRTPLANEFVSRYL